ncbi:endogenous retrovirus group K member 9 Env polyprotein-like [Camelus ferus]|uniref:Endogenous retrovirus group K member 9 Env polyprotein-like n=1 Tax=Camelus ferus TaxID=419612 RepID=A0A8B8SMA1_CAMFR|nr:endogenous retrovirus group K member 9 Env polyprotein-like [Camelus ferus]
MASGGYLFIISNPLSSHPMDWSNQSHLTLDLQLTEEIKNLNQKGQQRSKPMKPTGSSPAKWKRQIDSATPWIAASTREAINISWGQIKKLDSQASKVLREAKVPHTPKYRFLAYQTVISHTSAQVLLFLLLFLSLPLMTGAHLYWARIIDPPVFRPVTWWDADPLLSTNDTQWTGGVWLAPQSHLLENSDWKMLNKTASFISSSPPHPICVSNVPSSFCLHGKTCTYLYCLPKTGTKHANLTFIFTAAFDINQTTSAAFTLPVAHCHMSKERSPHSQSVSWVPCRAPNPRGARLFNYRA